jgi:hypothetical protein
MFVRKHLPPIEDCAGLLLRYGQTLGEATEETVLPQDLLYQDLKVSSHRSVLTTPLPHSEIGKTGYWICCARKSMSRTVPAPHSTWQ